MKKQISVLAVLMALLMLTSCFVSCHKQEEPEEPAVEYTDIVEGGVSNYTVVLSESATSAVKSMANQIVSHIQEKTGVKISRVTDNTSKYPQGEHEILLGVSKRSETESALSSLTETGYLVKFENGKIILSASNDYMLQKAVDALLNTYFVSENETLKIDKNLNAFTSGTAEMSALLQDGSFRYTIVYPSDAGAEVRDAASDLATGIRSMLNCKVEVKMDSLVADNADNYEVLVGETNRQESKDLYQSLGVTDMRSVMTGNKIAVGSGIESNISLATNHFASLLQELVKGTYDENYLINLGFSASKAVYDWLNGVPTMSREHYIGTDDCGDNSIVMVWEEVSAEDFSSYIAQVKAADFTVKQEYTMGSNCHALLEGDTATIYASYIPAESLLRVFAEKKGSLYPSAEQTSYTTAEGYEPTMWQLSVDNKNSEANGGMSYVMKVADGSFVIIDGGYNTETEADNLYNHLKANCTDEKPVISAWIITHIHSDHYGAFQAFTKKYQNMVTVKAFYYNFPAEGYDFETTTIESTLNSDMKKYTGAVIYRKLHAGMTFWVADAKFDVIFTHEDMYPWYTYQSTTANTNDTSTVLKMTLGGKTVMFLGDIEARASRIIERYYVNDKAVLKSDIVQFAHHGYEGALPALYDMIEAPTVLWPMNIYGWQRPDSSKVFENWHQKSSTGKQALSNYYISYEATYVKTIVVAGEGITEFKLATYVPRSNRLPDYQSIHDAIASEQTT